MQVVRDSIVLPCDYGVDALGCIFKCDYDFHFVAIQKSPTLEKA